MHDVVAERGIVGVEVVPASGRTIVRLKSWITDYVTGGKTVSLAGRELPSMVGETQAGPARVLCIAPGEWLIVSEKHDPERLMEICRPDGAKFSLVVSDLSDALVTLEVKGGAARELLSKGCGLELHPRIFSAGRCARTRFAQLPTVVECLDESRFELHFGRSYFDYLRGWFGGLSA